MLESFDDGYEPDQSVTQVKKVIDGGDHLALIGPVGTLTTKATQPMTTKVQFPMIGAFTGAGFLRNAELGNVFNIRATYAAETEVWISYWIDGMQMQRVAILYQDDGFGRVGLSGVTAALEKRGMQLVAEGTYTRNTTAVKGALLDIRKSKPDAVVMVGAYKPIAEFIRLSRKLKFNPEFVNISFVGSQALADELGADGDGVIISQVVPFPWDSSVPVVAQYQAALAAHDSTAQPDFVSLEGYMIGRLTIEALKKAGPDITASSFGRALAKLKSVDLGGFPLEFGPNNNQGSDQVFLTRIRGEGGFDKVESGGAS